MSFITYLPTAPLSHYIEYLWGVQAALPYRREKLLPTGAIDLVINFGKPYRFIDKGQYQKRSWIVGVTNQYILSEALEASRDVIGVRFKPGGAHPFFHLPISELNDKLVETELVWGRFITEAREQLGEAKTLEERFSLLDKILKQRLEDKPKDQKLIQTAVAHINRPHTFTIKRLSNQLGISQKHLITQFKKSAGLPPKRLARIFRFNNVLQRIDPTRPVNWTDIAHQGLYYDQAHFNKDFAAFSGLTPTSYLDFRRRLLKPDLQPGEDIHFVPIG